MQGNPHNVEGQPPEADAETAPGAGADENPERQGPEGEPGPSDAPAEEEAPAQGPSGPPPESLPGEESQGTSPTE